MSSLISEQKTTAQGRVKINRQCSDNYQRGQINCPKRKRMKETSVNLPVPKRASLDLEKERNNSLYPPPPPPPPRAKCPAIVIAQRPSVWIIGDSYIRRGEDMASRSLGTDLGLRAKVTWFGRGGLRWHDLIPFFNQCLYGRTVPDVLVIHCGGNDLGQISNDNLISDMKRDLSELRERYPAMNIVLSSINQRRQWLWGTIHPKTIEPSRNCVNRDMDNFLQGLKGCIVHHNYIVFQKPWLFLKDNVHLSPLGNYIFLGNIAKCLRALIHQQCG